MKLTTITFDRTPRLPGVRAGDLTEIKLDEPPVPLRGWKLLLRGQVAYLVSPPGWSANEHRNANRDPSGPRIVYEMARSNLYLAWQAGDDADVEALMKGGKWESDPFGWKPAVVEADKPILPQVPPGQMGDA